MDNKKLIIDFCDESYATRQDLVKATQTSMVDPLWKQILEYRSRFSRPLGLTNVSNDGLIVVMTPVISEKINLIERKMTKALNRYSRLDPQSIAAVIIRDEQYKLSLGEIAKRYKLKPSENFLHSVVRNNVSALAIENIVLLNYFSALKYLEDHPTQPLNDDLLGFLFEAINGSAELTQYYRSNEVPSPTKWATVERVYLAAPVSRIDDMMTSLFKFANDSNSLGFLRAAASYYYFSYIKPFEYYSEELAVLFYKAVLTKTDGENVALMLNLERLIADNNERLEAMAYEVKKSGDFTYLLFEMIKIFDSALDQLLDQITVTEKKAIIEENYRMPATETAERVPAQPTFAPLPQSEPKPAIKETPIVPVASEVAPVEASPVAEKPESKPQEKAEPVPEFTSQRLASGGDVQYEQKLAVAAIAIGLDEADAAKLEVHLREMDPTLKKGEAYFYARHCTIGKFYTIDQFKKMLNCAYETARTSMEHLVEAGYYRKEQYKNKFIYTPLPRRR